MLEFLIDNVNIEVGNNVFRQRHELCSSAGKPFPVLL